MTQPAPELLTAVHALDLQPRQRRWNSLSWCVFDAVWSIGSQYDNVVVPLTRRVAALFTSQEPAPHPDELPATDPCPLSALLEAFPQPADLRKVMNGQRTSTRNGISKADAVLRYADVLHRHEVDTLSDAVALLAGDDRRFETVEEELAAVPGDGDDGVRRGYLWMLAGDDNGVKPDRMIRGWLATNGARVPTSRARELIVNIAARLSTAAAPVTPWMVDHAIWRAERDRRRGVPTHSRLGG